MINVKKIICQYCNTHLFFKQDFRSEILAITFTDSFICECEKTAVSTTFNGLIHRFLFLYIEHKDYTLISSDVSTNEECDLAVFDNHRRWKPINTHFNLINLPIAIVMKNIENYFKLQILE